MKNKVGLIKRLSILAVLLACLGFVSFTPHTQAMFAVPCCRDCPLPPPFDPEEAEAYCSNYCQFGTHTCYDNCIDRVYDCWFDCSNSPSCQ